MLPSRPKVAIIGPFYNSEKHVKGWINAIALQNERLDALYLVDDASNDNTVALLKESAAHWKLPAEILALPTNHGPASARNIAIQKALGGGADIILLLDSDCRVAPDWVERHVKFHAMNPQVQILGGAIQGSARSYVGQADGFCSWFTAVPFSRYGKVSRLHLSSTNLSLKAEVFEKIGFFDDKLATGEDVAFCRKAQRAGLVLWLQSDIVVTHLDRNNLHEAKQHHFRWGLHSYTLSLQEQGGYYGLLKKLNRRWCVAALVPVIAVLNTLLILIQYTRRAPRVWLYLPWIFLLKWSNARGVYEGFVNPNRCIR